MNLTLTQKKWLTIIVPIALIIFFYSGESDKEKKQREITEFKKTEIGKVLTAYSDKGSPYTYSGLKDIRKRTNKETGIMEYSMAIEPDIITPWKSLEILQKEGHEHSNRKAQALKRRLSNESEGAKSGFYRRLEEKRKANHWKKDMGFESNIEEE